MSNFVVSIRIDFADSDPSRQFTRRLSENLVSPVKPADVFAFDYEEATGRRETLTPMSLKQKLSSQLSKNSSQENLTHRESTAPEPTKNSQQQQQQQPLEANLSALSVLELSTKESNSSHSQRASFESSSNGFESATKKINKK